MRYVDALYRGMLLEMLGVAALFGVVSWVTTLGERDARLRRAAEKLPVTAMREVVDGRRVKVTGIAELPRAPLTAPISGRGCAGWIVDPQEKVEGRWNSVLTEWKTVDFVIVDDSGQAARIVVARASLVWELDDAAAASWSEPPTERVRAFLARHGRDVGRSFSGIYRCCEGGIEQGERVTVAGAARRELDPSPRVAEALYREAPTRLVFVNGPLCDRHCR